MQEPLISIILPVYNRLEYLSQAIDSVLNQTYNNWELIIADDASDVATQEFLNRYDRVSNIKVYSNPQNLGLFSNLNQGIRRSQGKYILLLCTDDFLLPECLQTSLSLLEAHQDSGLVLSAFRSVDAEGRELPSGAIYYYDRFLSKPLQLLKSEEVLPLLLKYGSINGNLSGMFFTRSLYERVGGFREDSIQIADWEWLYRVAKQSSILMSKTPVAVVRSHPRQLSAVNFKNLRNSLEVIEMVGILLRDPQLAKLESASQSALHIMQFHLWYAFKFALKGYWQQALTIAKEIERVTGFFNTFWAMLQWLPQRWQVYQEKSFPLPPE
jgi:glycosyltransferase involved in cell wall biosynthesis